jgi:hypothetical protein
MNHLEKTVNLLLILLVMCLVALTIALGNLSIQEIKIDKLEGDIKALSNTLTLYSNVDSTGIFRQVPARTQEEIDAGVEADNIFYVLAFYYTFHSREEADEFQRVLGH